VDRLSTYCIYTILHSDELRRQVAVGGRHSLTERTAWKTGSHLWAEAERSGERIPIVFSGADRATGLFYWATIDDVTVEHENQQTTCSYSSLREISPPRPLSALRLRNGNRQLSDDYIRPYAICETPSFLA
jgi:hypothetical protein